MTDEEYIQACRSLVIENGEVPYLTGNFSADKRAYVEGILARQAEESAAERGTRIHQAVEEVLTPVAERISELEARLEEAEGYTAWLEGEVDDLGSGRRESARVPMGREDARDLTLIAEASEKRAWAHTLRFFVLSALLVGVNVGGVYGMVPGAISTVSAGMSLMAILQLMQAVSYRDKALRVDEIMESHGAVRVGDRTLLQEV